MNRRLFFRALAGVPVVAVPPKPAQNVLHLEHSGFKCVGCGNNLLVQRLTYGDPLFVKCPVEICPQYNRALLVPEVPVAASPADPAYVRATEEAWCRKAAAEEERKRLAEIRREQDAERPEWVLYRVSDGPEETFTRRYDDAWAAFAADHGAWREKYQRWDEPDYVAVNRMLEHS